MAKPDPVASISGYAFASIVHEASKARNDSEGLLFGEVTTRNVCTISDSQSSGNREECDIAIQDMVPMSGCFSFYNHYGNLRTEKMGDLSKLGNMHLVGWYKIRRNSSARPSFREQLVLKKLITHQSSHTQKIFLLITPSTSGTLSTLNFSYKCFLGHKSGPPVATQMNVINLGHAGTHPDYRMHSLLIPSTSGSSSSMDGIYEEIIHQFCDKHGQMYQVNNMFDLYTAAVQKLQSNQSKLAESEEAIHRLRTDISGLKERLKSAQETTPNAFVKENYEVSNHDVEMEVEDEETNDACTNSKKVFKNVKDSQFGNAINSVNSLE